MNKVRWLANRVSLMSPQEIMWRIFKTGQVIGESVGIVGGEKAAAANAQRGAIWLNAPAYLFDHTDIVNAADRIVDGRFAVFALRDAFLGFPPPWNTDPKTGTRAPRRHGMSMNYRDQNVVGDIKYLWEINRHYEFVTLAQAAWLTGDEAYARAACALLDSWLTECPYPLGQAWASSLENAIRLVNWAVAWQLLHACDSTYFSSANGGALQERWLESIHRHCHFISRHLSKHSSANNHLFGEYMGLFIASVNWPCWEQSRAWREQAKHGLEREALIQNGQDGVNCEQAIWYHHEVADMMLLCLLFGEKNGVSFSPEYRQRLEFMLDFVASIMDVCGNVPMFGDADDAVMVRFSQSPDFNAYQSLLAAGAVLFGRPDFKARAEAFDDKCRWLYGVAGLSAFDALVDAGPEREPRRAFQEAGYYLLGHRFNRGDEIRIVADTGFLGYLSIAAHGHADALSFTLSAGGEEILVDPGTFAYHTEPKWRQYFRGTSAHNTIRVDGRDQSVQGGNFLWLHKANATCERWVSGPGVDELVGSHDGYRNLDNPVIHRRRLCFNKHDCSLTVEDTIECTGAHTAEIFWHFAEGCRVEAVGRTVQVTAGDVSVALSMPEASWLPQIVRGQEDPPLGWISRRFDVRQPSNTAVFRIPVQGNTTCVTIFRILQEKAYDFGDVQPHVVRAEARQDSQNIPG